VSHNQLNPILANKNPRLAIMLAVLWPGLDYFYLGAILSGSIRTLGSVFLMLSIVIDGHLFLLPAVLIIWIMGLTSSSKRTEKYNNPVAKAMRLKKSHPVGEVHFPSEEKQKVILEWLKSGNI
jgi:hypothetical protein